MQDLPEQEDIKHHWWRGCRLLHGDGVVHRLLRWRRVWKGKDRTIFLHLLPHSIVEMPEYRPAAPLPLDRDGENLLLWWEGGGGYQMRSKGSCREAWVKLRGQFWEEKSEKNLEGA